MKTAIIKEVKKSFVVITECPACKKSISLNITSSEIEEEKMFVVKCFQYECNEEFLLDLTNI